VFRGQGRGQFRTVLDSDVTSGLGPRRSWLTLDCMTLRPSLTLQDGDITEGESEAARRIGSANVVLGANHCFDQSLPDRPRTIAMHDRLDTTLQLISSPLSSLTTLVITWQPETRVDVWCCSRGTSR